MRSAARAIACSPDEQKRLMVMAGTVFGSPARSATARAMFIPASPSGNAQPRITSSISLRSDLRVFLQQRLHHDRGQIVRPGVAQRSFRRFADGGAKTIDNYGFHINLLFVVTSGSSRA